MDFVYRIFLCVPRVRAHVDVGVILIRSYYPECMAPNDRLTDELWVGNDLEGSGRGLIEVLSQHLHGDTE
jgi:hypothetical protein